MKKIFFALLTLLCLLLVAGCGGSSDKQATAPAGDKVLKVATGFTSPPFELYLKDQDKFTGFDIDLINGLAKKMGYSKVELVALPFEQILPGLKEKKYDLAMHNFSRTKARDAEYLSSDAYAKAGFSIAVRKDSGLTMKDINGRKIGIKARTSSERIAKSFPNVQIVEYPEVEDALHAAETGEVDYAIAGNLVTNFYITHTDTDNCLTVVGHSERQDDLVFYADKSNTELMTNLNAALKEFKRSGEYKELIKFYFGEIEKQEEEK